MSATSEKTEKQEKGSGKPAPGSGLKAFARKKENDGTDLRGWFRRLVPHTDGRTESALPGQIAYCYLAIPMAIFLLGWLRIPIAFFMVCVLGAGLFFACKHAPSMDVSALTKANLPKAAVIVLLAAVWVYFSGIGGYAYQNYDHMWRNAILEKLVSSDWPVIVTDTGDYFDKPVAFIYYFALWLPAACWGKLFGLEAAQGFLYLWCVIGVLLVFTLLLGLSRRLSPWIVIGFIFFSGLDAVGEFILHNNADYLWFTGNHLENWAYGFQMSSVTTQLFWVFNQAIPAWLITLLMLLQKDNRSLVFVYSFSFMTCTLPAIGMLPVIGCIFIRRIVQVYDKSRSFKENLRPVLLDFCTFQNLCTGLLLTLVSYLFLKSNTTGGSGFRLNDMERLLAPYLIFTLLEFVVYYLAIYAKKKRDPLYWVTFATLLLVPLVGFGEHVDFVMRASIPSLIVLYTMIVEALCGYRASGEKAAALVLTGLLVLGGLTAYHEIDRSVCGSVDHARDPEISVTASEIDLFEDGKRGNFFGEYQDSVFFRYLAK